jgi:nucleoside-diphosphate-sugar epimerase
MTTIQRGDTVLVTGATGYIGNHVVEELVAAGYHVRGTSRNAGKAQFLVDYIEKKYGKGHVDIVDVPDMIDEHAYDEAVKGVSGIVHLASVLTFSAVPDEVIPPSVKGTLNILKAATTEPKVKSLVVTSSSTAALIPVPNEKLTVTKDTWNEKVLETIRTNPSPSPYEVYAASKTEAEKALWKAVKETNPPFQVATVLPNANFGHRIRATGNSTGDWLLDTYNGKETALANSPPQYFINVRDDAKLHVIALTDPACNGDRIFGFADTYSLNKILAILRKLEPSRQFGEDKEMGEDLSEVPNAEAEALLKKHYGHGFVNLEDTIKEGIAPAALES